MTAEGGCPPVWIRGFFDEKLEGDDMTAARSRHFSVRPTPSGRAVVAGGVIKQHFYEDILALAWNIRHDVQGVLAGNSPGVGKKKTTICDHSTIVKLARRIDEDRQNNRMLPTTSQRGTPPRRPLSSMVSTTSASASATAVTSPSALRNPSGPRSSSPKESRSTRIALLGNDLPTRGSAVATSNAALSGLVADVNQVSGSPAVAVVPPQGDVEVKLQQQPQPQQQSQSQAYPPQMQPQQPQQQQQEFAEQYFPPEQQSAQKQARSDHLSPGHSGASQGASNGHDFYGQSTATAAAAAAAAAAVAAATVPPAANDFVGGYSQLNGSRDYSSENLAQTAPPGVYPSPYGQGSSTPPQSYAQARQQQQQQHQQQQYQQQQYQQQQQQQQRQQQQQQRQPRDWGSSTTPPRSRPRGTSPRTLGVRPQTNAELSRTLAELTQLLEGARIVGPRSNAGNRTPSRGAPTSPAATATTH